MQVSVGGTQPFSYTWRHEGTNLFAPSVSYLTITNAGRADAGAYDVIVSNINGIITSSVAQVTVNFVAFVENGFRWSSSGFEFKVDATAGSTVVTESSTNLMLWTPLFTNIAPPAPFPILDTSASSSPAKFYRVKLNSP